MLRLMSSASSSGGRSTHWSGGFIERPPLFTVRPMTFAGYSLLVRSFTLAGLTLILGACMDSGGGASPTTQANSVTISGTVGGTRIVAMNDNDQIVVEDDTAGRPAGPRVHRADSLSPWRVCQSDRTFVYFSSATAVCFLSTSAGPTYSSPTARDRSAWVSSQ